MIISDKELRVIEERIADDVPEQPLDVAALIDRYIELNPHRPWLEDARLVEFGIPAWAIVAYLPAVDNDISQAALDYDIPWEAVVAVIHFYAAHKPAIDARIAANDESMIC